MIEVKETIEPFVPSAVEPTKKAVITPVAPPPVRSITSAVEDEEETEREDNYEIRQAAAELDGFKDYMREQKGDGLNYGDW